jgi:hypothetical protein
VAVALLFASCSAKSVPDPPRSSGPLTRAGEGPPPGSDPKEPATSTSAPQPYLEEVELEDEEAWAEVHFLSEFADGYALVRPDVLRRLVDLRTLEFVEFPPFAEEHDDAPHFLTQADGEWVVAYFDQGDHAEFEVLEVATMRWTPAPPIEIPPRPSPTDPRNRRKAKSKPKPKSRDEVRSRSRFSVWFRGDRVRVTLSDDGETARYLDLDPATLVWEERPAEEVEASDPCPMPCGFPGRDVIRWGRDYEGNACVAHRETPDDQWSVLQTEQAHCFRSCRPLPGGDVLVTGGIEDCEFSIFNMNFSQDVAILDTSELKIRDLGEGPPLGHVMDVGTDELVWLRSGFVIRFDPETETFSEEPGPLVDFEDRWKIRIDERTMLIGGETRGEDPRPIVAKFGFR